VSRTEFRVPVNTPRPFGALVMVLIASSALTLSGRIPAFVLALHALSVCAALLLRPQPRRWQRMNLPFLGALLAVLLLCLFLWAENRLVALASATMLTQGLQLLSTRPRRTEFPLVGLALAQMIFASMLTESALYPVLLVAFLLMGVWTLLLHTLQAEAFEAHDPLLAQRVATPGLFQMTVLSACITVFMATPIFFALPRTRVALPHAQGEVGGSRAGFSNRVELGSLGTIRDDPSVQLRVRTLDAPTSLPAQTYWKGMTFDHFDGWAWSVSPLPSSSIFPQLADQSFELGSASTASAENFVRQEILREAMEPGIIFTSGQVQRIEGSITNLHRDFNGSIFAPQTLGTRFSYTIRYTPKPRRSQQLQADFADLPAERMSQRYLQLPNEPELVALLSERAVEITDGATSDAERARRIEHHLMTAGSYSRTPPSIDRSDPRTPIQGFLEDDLAAHCEYFATTMVLLARAVGLPARLVNGFAGGVENAVGDFVEIKGSDAHAWVEIHYASAGWVRYDPTPIDTSIRAAAPVGIFGRLAAGVDTLRLWWFQHIVDFNRTAQLQAMQATTQAALDLAESVLPESSPAKPEAAPQRTRIIRIGLALLGIALPIALLLGLRARADLRESHFTPEYAAALALLRRRDLIPTATNTPRDFAERVRGSLPDGAAEAFARLTEHYQAERYGNHKTSLAREELHNLRDTLRG